MRTTKMNKLLNFTIKENYVLNGTEKTYFIKFKPPNLTIMSKLEIEKEIDKMTDLFDSLNCKISFFVTDKVEDLRTQKKYFSSLPAEYEYIKIPLIERLESAEKDSLAIQRAYYFVFKESKGHKINTVLGVFDISGFSVVLAERKELVTVLRNFYLKEFATSDIYTMGQEIKEGQYKNAKELKGVMIEREITKRIIPNQIDFGIDSFRHNDVYRKAMIIKNFPSKIRPTILLKLAQLRNTTVNIRCSPLNLRESKKLIENQDMVQRGRSQSHKITDSEDGKRGQKLITELYRDISSKGKSVYIVNVYIEIHGTKEEISRAEKEVENFLDSGVSIDKMILTQQKGFIGVEPLGRDTCLSVANNLPSGTLSALYPCSYSSWIDDKGLLAGKTKDGGIFMLDFNRRTERITSSNVVVTGGQGQGKTTILHKMINSSYMEGETVFILDPDNEYGEHVKKLKGTVINCAQGKYKINPFEVRMVFSEADFADEDTISDMAGEFSEFLDNRATFLQHLSWLMDFMQIVFPELDIFHIKAVMKIIKATYARMGISETTDFSNLASTDYPNFTDVYGTIDIVDFSEFISDDVLKNLKLVLEDCHNGTLSALLNGYTNIPNARLMCFQQAELLEGSEERIRAVNANITSYIWNLVLQRKTTINLFIDELYLFLEDTRQAKYLKSYVKRDRKYEAKLIIATQQVGDCLKGKAKDYATAIFDNSPFHFTFFPGEADLNIVKDALHLKEGELAAISKPKKGSCLVRMGGESFLVLIDRLPFEKEMFGDKGGR